MKKILFYSFAMLVMACGNNAGTDKTQPSENNSTAAPKEDELYFNFTIDGKPQQIDAADISTSYNVTSKDSVFKIFAGKDGGLTLLLTIPHNMAAPSSTPSGSPDYALNITQGSVSLQNYPKPTFTFNSFGTTDPKESVVTPDAIVVTASEKVKDGRIITGTINVKVFGGDNKQNDPDIKDYIIAGKFRIKHEFRGSEF